MATSKHWPLYSSPEVIRKRVKPAAGVASLVAAFVVCAFAAASAGAARPAAQRPSSDGAVKVRFTADAPETDIFVQQVSLSGQELGPKQQLRTGRVGPDGEISIELPPGRYRAVGRKAGYKDSTIEFSVIARQPIPRPFNFQMIPAPTPAPTPTPTPQPTPTPVPTPSAIERFLNPKESDQVSLEDWRQFRTVTYQKLSSTPDDARLKKELWFAEGQINLLTDNFATAVGQFQSALNVDDKYALAVYGMGAAHFAKKEYNQAVEVCGRAIKLDESLWLGHRCQAEAYDRMKSKDRARAAQARAAALGYLPRGASLGTVRTLVEQKRWDEALPLLQALRKQEPASVEVNTLLGDVYVGLNQRIKARDAYAEAIKDKTAASWEAHSELCELYLRDNDPDQGLLHIREAIKLYRGMTSIDPKKLRELEKLEADAIKAINRQK